MSLSESIKLALKRGALITAANWEVVVIQFIADSVFKALLTVPVIGAAFLFALIVGSSVPDVPRRRFANDGTPRPDHPRRAQGGARGVSPQA